MGLGMVCRVWRYQGQCRALRPPGHQGYKLRSDQKDPPLQSGCKTLLLESPWTHLDYRPSRGYQLS